MLDGWSIQKQASASTSAIYKKALSGTIPAHGYYLIVRGDTTTAQSLKDKANILAAATFSLSNDNSIYLVRNDTNIEGKSDSDIVDMLGFGAAENREAVAATNPGEGKSLGRKGLGEDSDNNANDFQIFDQPTPATANSTDDPGMGGEVLLTVVLVDDEVTDIGSGGAVANFYVNDTANALILYGLSDAYGQTSAAKAVTAGGAQSISLSGLDCGTEYHFAVRVSTADGRSDQSEDVTFTTLPCGLRLDGLKLVRGSAKANNQYVSGWSWELSATVWDPLETKLAMRFIPWTGPATLAAGGNMRYSVDGVVWREIVTDNAFPSETIDISAIDRDTSALGRQIMVKIEMKVPVGTLAGAYASDYELSITN